MAWNDHEDEKPPTLNDYFFYGSICLGAMYVILKMLGYL